MFWPETGNTCHREDSIEFDPQSGLVILAFWRLSWFPSWPKDATDQQATYSSSITIQRSLLIGVLRPHWFGLYLGVGRSWTTRESWIWLLSPPVIGSFASWTIYRTARPWTMMYHTPFSLTAGVTNENKEWKTESTCEWSNRCNCATRDNVLLALGERLLYVTECGS